MSLLNTLQNVLHSPTHLFPLILTSVLLLAAVKAFHRLYLHPLRHFPGPRLAASTSLYTTYHNCLRSGLSLSLPRLHSRYGPVVRTGPNTLHFTSPAAFQTIYSTDTTFRKDASFYDFFRSPKALPMIVDPAVHKPRRDQLGAFFSRRNISNLQHVVREKQEVMERMFRQTGGENGKGVVSLFYAYRCVTLDIITEMMFGKAAGCLEGLSGDKNGFEHPILKGLTAGLDLMWWQRHFKPVAYAVTEVLPELAKYLPSWVPGVALARLFSMIDAQAAHYKKNPHELMSLENNTIYKFMLTPTAKGHQLAVDDETLKHDGRTLIFAGAETTANTLTIGSAYIARNPEIQEKLYHDLKTVWPDKDSPCPSWEKLETCAYLTAVVKEAIRITLGVQTPLPRVTTKERFIDGVLVPAGTVVSSGIPFVNQNPDVYPNPEVFSPERWMSGDVSYLSRMLSSFSGGVRNCAGLNLAYCETYMVLAQVFRRFEVELYEWSDDGFTVRADRFVPVYKGQVKATLKPRGD